MGGGSVFLEGLGIKVMVAENFLAYVFLNDERTGLFSVKITLMSLSNSANTKCVYEIKF